MHIKLDLHEPHDLKQGVSDGSQPLFGFICSLDVCFITRHYRQLHVQLHPHHFYHLYFLQNSLHALFQQHPVKNGKLMLQAQLKRLQADRGFRRKKVKKKKRDTSKQVAVKCGEVVFRL